MSGPLTLPLRASATSSRRWSSSQAVKSSGLPNSWSWYGRESRSQSQRSFSPISYASSTVSSADVPGSARRKARWNASARSPRPRAVSSVR